MRKPTVAFSSSTDDRRRCVAGIAGSRSCIEYIATRRYRNQRLPGCKPPMPEFPPSHTISIPAHLSQWAAELYDTSLRWHPSELQTRQFARNINPQVCYCRACTTIPFGLHERARRLSESRASAITFGPSRLERASPSPASTTYRKMRSSGDLSHLT